MAWGSFAIGFLVGVLVCAVILFVLFCRYAPLLAEAIDQTLTELDAHRKTNPFIRKRA